MIAEKIKNVIRDVHDFPKPGIVFKDITPILKDAELCKEIVQMMVTQLKDVEIDVVVGIESRGFLFGLALANELGVPFVPIRKKGKLPFKTIQQSYDLEYGSATLEVHEDAFEAGQNVLIHDDLLATGGTVVAASALVQKLNANVVGYSFIINLDFLNGKQRLNDFSSNVFYLVAY
jgi:adenine phosphoribosyltransferase